MGKEDGNMSGDTTPVSMDDLKELETTLTSSMNAQLKELRDMMAQLLNGSTPPPPASPSLEVNASAAQSGEGEQPIKDPHLKLMVGMRSTIRFYLFTPPTQLSLILI